MSKEIANRNQVLELIVIQLQERSCKYVHLRIDKGFYDHMNI